MRNQLDPKDFGLPARTILQQVSTYEVVLIVQRKSRIIMADGKKIVEKAQKILDVNPSLRVTLQTNAPVCSKTVEFLKAEGIQIRPI